MEKYKIKRPKESEMIFGTRAVLEAIEAGKVFDKILLRRDMSSAIGKELLEKIPHGTWIQKVPVERLNKYTDKNHQGVIAFISPIEFCSVETIVMNAFEAGKTPLLLLLDGITDVRNFGAIARTCVCTGVDALIISTRGSVAINGDAIKASAGALMSLPICKTEKIANAIEYLKASGFQVLASTEHAQKTYTQADMTLPTTIVMGSEGFGIYHENLEACTDAIKIPILGSIESLNVSVAAGVMLYEVVRQRKLQ